MPNLTSQIIGKVTCPECNKPTPLKVNKNGIAYYYCTNFADSCMGPCNHHQKWNRARSIEFQRAYLKQRAANDNEPRKVAANDNAPDGVAGEIKPEPMPVTYANEGEPVTVDRAEAANDNTPNVSLPAPPSALFGAW